VSILSACEPRQDIITGSFNPEIFTASLSEVMLHYREGSAGVHSIYTDASQFFSEATYPTDGLKMVLASPA
jgi:predicted AAA+ superfamily ATPase